MAKRSKFRVGDEVLTTDSRVSVDLGLGFWCLLFPSLPVSSEVPGSLLFPPYILLIVLGLVTFGFYFCLPSRNSWGFERLVSMRVFM